MKYKDAYKAIFGEDFKKEVYQMKPHSFNKVVGGKHTCSSCGLVALNNPFSQWSVEKGCFSDLHPEFKSVRKRYTRML